MHARRAVVILGPVVVAVYAAVMVAVICVWDPVAAVPSLPHATIIARVNADTGPQGDPFRIPVVVACAGFALSVAASIVGSVGRVRTTTIGMLHLVILAAGAPATFAASFPLGMDVADTFGVSGGAHTPWTGVLYQVSLLAFALVMAGAFWPAVRRRSAVRPTVQENAP